MKTGNQRLLFNRPWKCKACQACGRVDLYAGGIKYLAETLRRDHKAQSPDCKFFSDNIEITMSALDLIAL